MMKSYKKWKREEQVRHRLAALVLEWSLQSLWRRGAGSEEEQEDLERLGSLLGKKSGFVGKLFGGRDTAQQGEDLKRMLDSGNFDPSVFIKSAAPNSPFNQAYMNFNKWAGVVKAGGFHAEAPIKNQNTLKLMVEIFSNAHKGGTITFGKLKEFWEIVTGFNTNFKKPGFRKLLVANDIHTPLHLLKTIFPIGNGIFAPSSDFQQLYAGSEQILKKYFKSVYEQNLGGINSQTQKKAIKRQAPAGQAPAGQAPAGQAPAANAQVINALSGLLQNITDPNQKAILQQVLQTLQGSTPPPVPPPAPAAPAPAPTKNP